MQNKENIIKYNGKTMEQYIEDGLEEFEYDEISLWDILWETNYFRLNKKETNEFIFMNIVKMIEFGAKVVLPSDKKQYVLVITDRYGITPEEIAKNIMKDLEKDKSIAERFGGVAFAAVNNGGYEMINDDGKVYLKYI